MSPHVPSMFALCDLAFFDPLPLSLCLCLCHGWTCVCVCVCVFVSGTEDSYTLTCGMPLPCLAEAQKNNSGLNCFGKYTRSDTLSGDLQYLYPQNKITDNITQMLLFF